MKKTLLVGVATALTSIMPYIAHADGMHTGNIKADSHAPMGVMGDHMHNKGEWMISYRTMYMTMDGMRDGTDELSTSEVLTSTPASPTDYAMTPVKMTAEMHMIGGMYAPTNNLTLTAMGSYIIRESKNQTDAATRFTTRSEGIGDLKLSGIIRLYDDDIHHVHLNAGFSVPTGSIEESDGTPAVPAGTRLPFKMQPGSGTLDIMPGITYVGKNDHLGWGAQYKANLHMGRNSNNYSLGDVHEVTGWGSYRFADWISSSISLTGKTEAKVDGNQMNAAMPTMTPATDPDNYGGEKIHLGFGVNLAGQGQLHGHRLGAEIRVPVYQDLNGPQLQDSSSIIMGYQYSW